MKLKDLANILNLMESDLREAIIEVIEDRDEQIAKEQDEAHNAAINDSFDNYGSGD